MEDLKDVIEIENLDEAKELGVDEIDITEPSEPVTEPTDEVSAEAEEMSDEAENEPTVDADEPTEADAEADTEEESDGEEAEVEEVADDEEADDEDEGEEAEEDAEELAIVTDLREQIQSLTNKISELAEANAKLKKTNRKLSAKYQSELDKKEKFKESLKGISVELLPDEGEKKPEKKAMVFDKNYVKDGIGEL